MLNLLKTPKHSKFVIEIQKSINLRLKKGVTSEILNVNQVKDLIKEIKDPLTDDKDILINLY